jgi:hypothetical protein
MHTSGQSEPRGSSALAAFSFGMAGSVSDAVVLQYVGFETKGTVREYAFTLRGSGGESSPYFVTIANAAFVEHRVRYQDAPDICSIRLHRELATHTDHLSSSHFFVTDAELADYKSAHTPKPKPKGYADSDDKWS